MPERFVNGVLLKPTIDWDLIPPFIFLKKQMLSQMAYRTRLDEIAEYLFFLCSRNMNSLRLRFGDDYEQPTSVPMLTDAYNLPAKKVIHIVGPMVQYSLTPEHEEALADCYRNTLDMCRDNGLRSVAFCCISTGVFNFPNYRAAEIAVRTVSEWMEADNDSLDRIIFNVFKDEDKEYYEELLK